VNVEQRSVRSVGHARWNEAQAAERALWVESQRRRGWKRLAWPVARPLLAVVGSRRITGDDRNLWWREQFDRFEFLPRDLGDYIELGCGPYTNTRLILRGRSAQRVVCSDPLIRTYLTFSGRWLAEAYRAGKVEVDDHPVEECPFPQSSFDVVVMINVLEHVQDADVCMRTATGLVRSGGFFVLGNRLVALDGLGHDPLHPIRLARSDLDPYLAEFEPLIDKHLDPTQGADGPDPNFSNLIFAGRKPR
jgi:SAM-dependent methyltransferase